MLVVTELECTLVTQGASTFGTASAVVFPAIGIMTEFLTTGETLHDAQLHDVQAVIEGTSEHLQARS